MTKPVTKSASPATRPGMTLHLGPHEIDLCFDEDISREGLNGDASFGRLKIRLADDLHGSRLKEILLHECVHLVQSANAFDVSEQQTRAMGLGLSQLLSPFLCLEAIDK